MTRIGYDIDKAPLSIEQSPLSNHLAHVTNTHSLLARFNPRGGYTLIDDTRWIYGLTVQGIDEPASWSTISGLAYNKAHRPITSSKSRTNTHQMHDRHKEGGIPDGKYTVGVGCESIIYANNEPPSWCTTSGLAYNRIRHPVTSFTSWTSTHPLHDGYKRRAYCSV